MCPTSCQVRVCLPIFRVSGVLYRVILLQMPGPTHMSCHVRVDVASHWGAKELYRRLCRRCMSPACARCLSALEVATSASAPYTCCTPGKRAGCMLQPPLCMHLELGTGASCTAGYISYQQIFRLTSTAHVMHLASSRHLASSGLRFVRIPAVWCRGERRPRRCEVDVCDGRQGPWRCCCG